jgi:outer membrane protein OmpA-like peptidoglycan-associated protein|tara:strand:+ start:1671 stop:2852 length:1182 start_codon:yes stop_codon:yes gene_type:complete
MRNHVKTLIILLSLVINYNAQDENNLVLNPSFESIDGKLKKLTQINIAKDWDSPTALKADLYSSSITGDISVPKNIYGKEFPKDGQNYAGILGYSYNNKKPRTYLQSKLVKPLASGLEYCVTIHVSLADLSKYAIDNIGIHFSDEQIKLDKKGDIIFSNKSELASVVSNDKSKIYKARYKWETVCGIYKADGKERFITIGNFYNNKDTKYEKLTKLDSFAETQLAEAYYYVDKVDVKLVEDPSSCNCDDDKENKRESIIYHLDVEVDESFPLAVKLKKNAIYFDVETFNIDPMFDNNLNYVIKLLNENPDLKLQLNGHIDNLEKDAVKNDPENKELINLGNYRSKSVKDYLTRNGISSERLSAQDVGSDQPASKGTSPFSFAKNRRVEFIIIK